MVTQLNSYAIALAVISAESLALALIVWQVRREKRGVIPFTLLMIGLAVWSLSYAVELWWPDLPGKIWAIRFEFVGIVSAPVMIFLFCADNTGGDRWLTRRNLILISVIPSLSLIALWTTDYHHLFYSQMGIDTSGPFPILTVERGMWFWIHTAYSYLMMLFGLAILVRALYRSPQLYRGQAATVLAAMLVPWIGNAIYISGLSPFGELDITPFFFAITGLMFSLSLMRFRLLDIVPSARDMVLESMREAVMVFDLERRIVDLNPAARTIIGPAADQAIGKTLAEMLPEQKDVIARFRDKEEALAEVTLPVNGQDTTIEIRISTLRARGGAPTGRLVVIRDVTEAKITEKKLAEARDQALEALRMRTRILAVVSHELRTPLGAILGYADMLRAGAQGPITESQLAMVNRMITNAVHLTDMVNDLLDEAQIEQGKITLHISPIESSRVLEAIEASMGHRAREQGLKLVTEIGKDAPEIVRTDLSRLTQVVNNLVGNALKFTKEGNVTVRFLKIDEKRWGVSVSDNGPGIAEENQKLIFEPFWQVDNPETREHKGVGLGLSIARQMTHLLGGEIKLDSAPGKGTTFTVSFPWDLVKEHLKSVEKVSGAGG